MPLNFTLKPQQTQCIPKPLRIPHHTRHPSIQANRSLNPTLLTDLVLHTHSNTERSLVDNGSLAETEFVRRFEVVDFDVPGIPVEGLVVVED